MKMGKAPDIQWRPHTTFHVIVLLLLSMCQLSQQQGPSAPPPPPPPPPPRAKVARQAPFCIDETTLDPPEEALAKFVDIFKFHANNSYVPVSDGKTSPAGLITEFKVTGIKVDDSSSGYKATLHNWVHITMKSAVKLEGLYVQAISAPWGTPFGEFIVDFDCSDCSEHPTSELLSEITVVPCIHRPALEYMHPNVLTVGGKRYHYIRPTILFDEIHFNFRYTQYPGVDHTFAQFLIIAVRDFFQDADRWETFFSPIYEMKIDKNPIGAYTPFYYGWPPKDIHCHKASLANEFEPVNIGKGGKYKIRYSPEFDKCVLNKAGKDWYTCPPGPIKLKENDVPTTLDKWKELRRNYVNIKHKDPSVDKSTTGNLKGGQLCADSGMWELNTGQVNWTIKVVYGPGGIDGGVADEIDKIDRTKHFFEDIDCEDFVKRPSYYGNDPKIADICSRDAACFNVHLSACDNANDIPLPTYGKNGDGTRPVVTPANWTTLPFGEQVDEVAWRWGDGILLLHGQLMIFSVTSGFNIIAFAARYMKEGRAIEERSGYFGIGKWLWIHMGVTYCMVGASTSGLLLVAFQNYQGKLLPDDLVNGPRDLCNVRPTKIQTDLCLSTRGHRYVGLFSAMLFLMSYATAWARPVSGGFRNVILLYHVICGYLSKLAGIGSILFSGYSLSITTVVYLILIELSSLIGFIFAEFTICIIDKKLKITNRKRLPVLEAIIVDELPSSHATSKNSLFMLFILVQIVLFVMCTLQSTLLFHSDFD